MKNKAKTPVAGKNATGKNKSTGKGSASSGRAAKPAKRTSRKKKKVGFFAWLKNLFFGKKKSKKKNKNQQKKSTVAKAEEKKQTPSGKTVRKIKQRKNVSKTIPNGRTLQTRDEYFEGDGNYRKPGYEDKGLYRSAVVVDSNRNNDLAIVVMTKSKKGEDVPGREGSKYRPFVETKDDEGQPIRIGNKFKENKPKKDLSAKAISTIKKLSFSTAGNAEENRKKVREIKGRK